jgi:sodium pump decarboxylase gamma subunit
MSFTPKYSLGENMSRAALNTLLGMGTVFVVLVFLSLLISCFKFISIAEQKIKAKNTPVQASAQAPVSVAAPEVPAAEEEELVDDLELVAVITAAIAAATNSSTDGLVVRSIKRAPAAKWKRA